MAKVETTETIVKKAHYLNELGEEFTLIRVNNSFRLESDYFGKSSSSANRKIPPAELGFIRRIKNHVLQNYVYENFLDKLYYPNKIDYVDINFNYDKLEENDLVEIDIDEAYWRTAFLLDVIPENLYLEGSKEAGKISKIGRLVSLGSLAKKEYRYSFKGKKLIRKEEIRSKLTENVWYSICKRVSDLMWQAKKIAGDNYVLFWVDGIYVKSDQKTIDKITALFRSFDYEVKYKFDLKSEFKKDRVIVTDKKSDKTRTFFIPKQKSKKKHFSDRRLKELSEKYSQPAIINEIEKDYDEK